jgi:hypothetical protein
MDTVRLETIEMLSRYVESGGAVFANTMVPAYAAEGPEGDERVRVLVKRILAADGREKSGAEGGSIIESLKARVPPNCDLSPPSKHLLCTRLSRGGGFTYLLVNTGEEEYAGMCTLRSTGEASLLDPESGNRRKAGVVKREGTAVQIPLALEPFHSLAIEFR